MRCSGKNRCIVADYFLEKRIDGLAVIRIPSEDPWLKGQIVEAFDVPEPNSKQKGANRKALATALCQHDT